MSSQTAVIIGQPETCLRLEQQLNLLPVRPITIGWILANPVDIAHCQPSDPILGHIGQLEAVVAHRRPDVALLSLPAPFTEQIQLIRTRLRKLGVPDRFMPTLEDQLAGVGPRTQFTIDVAQLLDRPPRMFDEALVAQLLRGRRVLITGAGGSIGSELSRQVASFDPEALFLVERSENALFEIDRQVARMAPDVPRRACLNDVVYASETRALFARLEPEVVFHAAAHKHVPMMEDHPAQAVENNFFGTRSVANASIESGVERFVLISSDKAVNPTSIMGATKRLAEMYVQHVHPQTTTGFSMVRFGNVLGSSGSVIEVWSKQLAEGGPLTVTDPRMTRYFMTIPEAASLVIQAAALSEPSGPDAEVFVLNMGEPVRIVEMATRFASLHGLRAMQGGRGASHGIGEIDLVFTGVRPGEKLFEELARDSDALRPTRHPDIDIWGIRRPEAQYIEEIVERLQVARRTRNPRNVAALVREIVPEMTQPAAA